MAKTKLLVDTDIFIEYLNHGSYRSLLYHSELTIHYSIVSKKELLSKQGLSETERRAILVVLQQFRLIPLDDSIAQTYWKLRTAYRSLEKEDLLIAATAVTRKMPLLTRNAKHFRQISEIILFTDK